MIALPLAAVLSRRFTAFRCCSDLLNTDYCICYRWAQGRLCWRNFTALLPGMGVEPQPMAILIIVCHAF